MKTVRPSDPPSVRAAHPRSASTLSSTALPSAIRVQRCPGTLAYHIAPPVPAQIPSGAASHAEPRTTMALRPGTCLARPPRHLHRFHLHRRRRPVTRRSGRQHQPPAPRASDPEGEITPHRCGHRRRRSRRPPSTGHPVLAPGGACYNKHRGSPQVDLLWDAHSPSRTVVVSSSCLPIQAARQGGCLPESECSAGRLRGWVSKPVEQFTECFSVAVERCPPVGSQR